MKLQTISLIIMSFIKKFMDRPDIIGFKFGGKRIEIATSIVFTFIHIRTHTNTQTCIHKYTDMHTHIHTENLSSHKIGEEI